MHKAVFEHYRASRYEPAVAWYDSKALHNQQMYRRVQWVLAASIFLTPVFIGFGFLVPHEYRWFKMLPLTTSGIVAAASALQGWFKFEQLWLNYRATCEALRREVHLYDAGIGDYASPAPFPEKAFVTKVEALIAREADQWQEVVRSKEQANCVAPDH